jgi:hypothetical protein
LKRETDAMEREVWDRKALLEPRLERNRAVR